jgi:hypothetical protein
MNPPSIEFYQGTGYGVINNTLRDNNVTHKVLLDYKEDEPVLQHIWNIDNSLRVVKSLIGRTLYRGIPRNIIDTFSNGNIFIDKGYSSCSVSPEVARQFTDGECCIFMFILPNDIPVYKLEYKGNYTEEEILLCRNIEWTIREMRDNVYLCTIKPYKLRDMSQTDKKAMEAMRQELFNRMLEEEDFTDDEEF